MEDASREQAEVFVDAEDVGQAGHGLGGQAEAHICQAGHAGVVLSHRSSHTCAPGTGRVVRRDKRCTDKMACVRECRANWRHMALACAWRAHRMRITRLAVCAAGRTQWSGGMIHAFPMLEAGGARGAGVEAQAARAPATTPCGPARASPPERHLSSTRQREEPAAL